MVNFPFSLRRTERDTERQLTLARNLLRKKGISMFPDGMLLKALQEAPVLGSGTFGTCYKVQVYMDSHLVDAAVKLFHTESLLYNALDEASVYQQLADVPRVPHLIGVSLAPLCIVTTMHGPVTLVDAVMQSSSTSGMDLLRALDQLADTVQKIHEKELVHNDLKFDNVLISRTPISGDITITLVDMGAVRAVGVRLYYGKKLSAERYPNLAPEVLSGGPVSPHSDAFSLGWMLSRVLERLPDSLTVAQCMAVAQQCMHPDPSQRLTITVMHTAITNLINSP